MSKIGRKHIALDGLKVEVRGNNVHYSGKHATGEYVLPPVLSASVDGELGLSIQPANEADRFVAEVKEQWGLHRALLNNHLMGARAPFEKIIEIKGLGFKALPKGSRLEFALGFSHKIVYEVPKGVSVAVDKTGQKITLASPHKELLGHVGSQIRSLRPPEPYKGTGIEYAGVVIRRKAGKTK